MLTRIVKMEFNPENISEFKTNFEQVKHKIRAFKGCKKLMLLQDDANPSIFFTYSQWENPESLENYRNSALFLEVWSNTKKLFRSKAQAWSTSVIHTL
jgi:hypothetical protein